MKSFTVKELRDLCEHQIAIGNRNKHVMVSDDDEGNGYHALFYGFEDDESIINDLSKMGLFRTRSNSNDIVLLG